MPPSKKLKTPSPTEIARVITNSPALSENEFTLGDRTFKVVDLPYDDYILFMAELSPVLQNMVAGFAAARGVDMQVQISPLDLIKTCADRLPEMVRIVCKQTDPDITVEEVKLLGKTPFKLCTAVLKQLEQNKAITEIADFFVQILPLVKAAMNLNQ